MRHNDWDARNIPKENIQSELFKECDKLRGGDQLVVLLKVPPEPLINAIRERSPLFSFESKTSDNADWILEVSKASADDAQNRGCCGVCGGTNS